MAGGFRAGTRIMCFEERTLSHGEGGGDPFQGSPSHFSGILVFTSPESSLIPGAPAWTPPAPAHKALEEGSGAKAPRTPPKDAVKDPTRRFHPEPRGALKRSSRASTGATGSVGEMVGQTLSARLSFTVPPERSHSESLCSWVL